MSDSFKKSGTVVDIFSFSSQCSNSFKFLLFIARQWYHDRSARMFIVSTTSFSFVTLSRPINDYPIVLLIGSISVFWAVVDKQLLLSEQPPICREFSKCSSRHSDRSEFLNGLMYYAAFGCVHIQITKKYHYGTDIISMTFCVSFVELLP